MANDSYDQVASGLGGSKVDESVLTVGANVVKRQRVVIGDDAGTASLMAVKAASTAAVAADPAAVVSLSPNSPLPAAPALTKGTQGATGWAVQDLKDAGRNVSNFYNTAFVAATATDALLSIANFKGGALVAATTTPAVVTTGKVLRLSNITVGYVGIAAAALARVTLRANAAGVVAIGSAAAAGWIVGQPTSGTAGVVSTVGIDFADGLEFAAGTGIGFSVQGFGATGTAGAAGYVFVNAYGYEY